MSYIVPLWDDDFAFGDNSGKGYWNDNNEEDWDHEFENECDSDHTRNSRTVPIRLFLSKTNNASGHKTSSSESNSLLDYLGSCSSRATIKKTKGHYRAFSNSFCTPVLEKIIIEKSNLNNNCYQYIHLNGLIVSNDNNFHECYLNLKTLLYSNISPTSSIKSRHAVTSQSENQMLGEDMKPIYILKEARFKRLNNTTMIMTETIQQEQCIATMTSAFNLMYTRVETTSMRFASEDIKQTLQMCCDMLQCHHNRNRNICNTYSNNSNNISITCIRSFRVQIALIILTVHIRMLLNTLNEVESEIDVHELFEILFYFTTPSYQQSLQSNEQQKDLLQDLECTCISAALFVAAGRSPLTTEKVAKVVQSNSNCSEESSLGKISASTYTGATAATTVATTTSSQPRSRHLRNGSNIHWLSCGLTTSCHSRNSSANSTDCCVSSLGRIQEADARDRVISSPFPLLPMREMHIRKWQPDNQKLLPKMTLSRLTLHLLGTLGNRAARSRMLHSTAVFLLAASQNNLSLLQLFHGIDVMDESEAIIEALGGNDDGEVVQLLLQQAVTDHFYGAASLWTLDLSHPVPDTLVKDYSVDMMESPKKDFAGIALENHHLSRVACQMLSDVGNTYLDSQPRRTLVILEAALALLSRLHRADEEMRLTGQLAILAASTGDCSSANNHLSRLVSSNNVDVVNEARYASELLLKEHCDRGRFNDGIREVKKVLDYLMRKAALSSTQVDLVRCHSASDSLHLTLALTYFEAGNVQMSIRHLYFLFQYINTRQQSILNSHKKVAVLSWLVRVYMSLQDADSMDSILTAMRSIREECGLSTGIGSLSLPNMYPVENPVHTTGVCNCREVEVVDSGLRDSHTLRSNQQQQKQRQNQRWQHSDRNGKVLVTNKPPLAGCRCDPIECCLPRYCVTALHLDLGALAASLHLIRRHYRAALEAIYPTLYAVELIVRSDDACGQPRDGLMELSRLYLLTARILFEASKASTTIVFPFTIGTCITHRIVEENLNRIFLRKNFSKYRGGLLAEESEFLSYAAQSDEAPTTSFCTKTASYNSGSDLAKASVKYFRCAWSTSRLVGDELTAAEAATGVVDVQLSMLFVTDILLDNRSRSLSEVLIEQDNLSSRSLGVEQAQETNTSRCATTVDTNPMATDELFEDILGFQYEPIEETSNPVLASFDVVSSSDDEASTLSKLKNTDGIQTSCVSTSSEVLYDTRRHSRSRERLLSSTLQVANQVLQCASYADIPIPLITAQIILAESLLLKDEWSRALSMFCNARDLFLHLFVVSFAHSKPTNESHQQGMQYDTYNLHLTETENLSCHVIDIPIMRIAPLEEALGIHSLLGRLVRLLWSIAIYNDKHGIEVYDEDLPHVLRNQSAHPSMQSSSQCNLLSKNLLLVDVYLTSSAEISRLKAMAHKLGQSSVVSLKTLLSSASSSSKSMQSGASSVMVQPASSKTSSQSSKASIVSQDLRSRPFFFWNNSCLRADCSDPSISQSMYPDSMDSTVKPEVLRETWSELCSQDDAVEPALPLFQKRLPMEVQYSYKSTALSTASCSTPDEGISLKPPLAYATRIQPSDQSISHGSHVKRSASGTFRSFAFPCLHDVSGNLILCSVKDLQQISKQSWRCLFLWRRAHSRYGGRRSSIFSSGFKGHDTVLNLRSMQLDVRRAVRALSHLMKRHRVSLATKIILSTSSSGSSEDVSYCSSTVSVNGLEATADIVPQTMQMFPIEPLLYSHFYAHTNASCDDASMTNISSSTQASEVPFDAGDGSGAAAVVTKSPPTSVGLGLGSVPVDYWMKLCGSRSPCKGQFWACSSSDTDTGPPRLDSCSVEAVSNTASVMNSRHEELKTRLRGVILVLQVESVSLVAHPESGRVVALASPLHRCSLVTERRVDERHVTNVDETSPMETFFRDVMSFVQRSSPCYQSPILHQSEDVLDSSFTNGSSNDMSGEELMHHGHDDEFANDPRSSSQEETSPLRQGYRSRMSAPVAPVRSSVCSRCHITLVCATSTDISHLVHCLAQMTDGLKLTRCQRLIDITCDDAITEIFL